jgi:hypothetical protein
VARAAVPAAEFARLQVETKKRFARNIDALVQSVRRNPKDAGILILKISEIASGVHIATCKTRYTPEKWPNSRLSATRRRRKRKNLDAFE